MERPGGWAARRLEAGRLGGCRRIWFRVEGAAGLGSGGQRVQGRGDWGCALPWPSAPAPALRRLIKALALALAFGSGPDPGLKAFN